MVGDFLMSVFGEKLAAAKAAPREKCDPVEVLLNGVVERFVFEQVEGKTWAAVTARNPAVGAGLIALRYGYDVHKVVQEIAPKSGVALVDGVEVELTTDEWADLFAVVDGHSISLIADAIWYLNEWNPQQQIAAAKKA
jgi:hypothetical protein